jgi:hypothetical protein
VNDANNDQILVKDIIAADQTFINGMRRMVGSFLVVAIFIG